MLHTHNILKRKTGHFRKISFFSFKSAYKKKSKKEEKPQIMACESQRDDPADSNSKAKELYKKARSLFKENREESIQKGKEFLLESAKLKYSPAEYLLGKYLINGKYYQQDTSTGLINLQSAADQNHKNAILLIAHLYEFGDIITSNSKMALLYYEKASSLNIPSANNILGSFYEKGIHGLQKDVEKAIHYYRLAADQNYPIAMFNLAMILSTTGDQNYLDYLMKAAEAGVPQAQFNVAIRRDIDRSLKQKYMKSAADSGLARACYYYSIYTDNEEEKAKYMEMAAEKGYVKALPESLDYLKEKSPQKLRVLLQKASQPDGDFTNSQIVLQQLIKEAEGKDDAESMYLRGLGSDNFDELESAAELGHRDAKLLVSVVKRDFEATKEIAGSGEDAAAMNNLARMYEEGEGVEKDEEKALELYRQASEKGSEIATYNLILLLTKRGNTKEAVKVARKEYRTNQNPRTMYDLASALLNNNEIEEGMELLKSSCDQNNPHAMYHYAILLNNGQHVEKNADLAKELFLKCANMDEKNGAFAFAAAKVTKYSERQRYLDRSVNLGYPPALYYVAKISHHEIAKPILEKLVDCKDFPDIAATSKKLLESLK